MMQTELSKLTREDRKELELEIYDLKRKIEEEPTKDIRDLELSIRELRRLRRLRK